MIADAGNQQLAVRSGHDGCQNSRQEDTGDEYREDLRYHANVDGFLIAVIEQQSVAEEHTAGNANHDSCGQRDKHPYRSNAAGFLDRLRRRNTHETDEDMRLTEVAETPCKQRDDAHCSIRHAGRTVNEHIQEIRIERFHLREELGRAAHREDSDGRNRKHAEEHQDALEEVGPANSEKPPANVYEITTTAPTSSDTMYGMPNTDENSFAQDTKPDAV